MVRRLRSRRWPNARPSCSGPVPGPAPPVRRARVPHEPRRLLNAALHHDNPRFTGRPPRRRVSPALSPKRNGRALHPQWTVVPADAPGVATLPPVRALVSRRSGRIPRVLLDLLVGLLAGPGARAAGDRVGLADRTRGVRFPARPEVVAHLPAR